MLNAQQRLDESRSRIYRSNDWLWWTLASFVNDQEKIYLAKHGTNAVGYTESHSDIDGFLSLIDVISTDEDFVEALAKDEDWYRDHCKDVEESTQMMLEGLKKKLALL